MSIQAGRAGLPERVRSPNRSCWPARKPISWASRYGQQRRLQRAPRADDLAPTGRVEGRNGGGYEVVGDPVIDLAWHVEVRCSWPARRAPPWAPTGGGECRNGGGYEMLGDPVIDLAWHVEVRCSWPPA